MRAHTGYNGRPTLHTRGYTPICSIPPKKSDGLSNHHIPTIGKLQCINLNESFECLVFLKTCFMWFNGVEIYINWQSGSRSLRHQRLMGSRGLKLCMHFVETGREEEENPTNFDFCVFFFPPLSTHCTMVNCTCIKLYIVFKCTVHMPQKYCPSPPYP